MMIDHVLTDKELQLVLELLENERKQLLPETRHTDTRSMREALKARLQALDRLIERFHEIQAGNYST
jgi:hypothetical protein